ncbi:MAG: hypothetical protein ACPGU3_07895 [Litorivicinus sp.]
MGKVIDSRSRFSSGQQDPKQAKLYQGLADLYSHYVNSVETIREQANNEQRSQEWLDQQLSDASSQYHRKRQHLLQSKVD